MSLKDKLDTKEKEFKEKFGGSFWNPEEGEILEGRVTELGTEKTQFRNDQPFIVVAGKKVWCNALLEGLCTEEDVNVGDVIAIKYLGSRKSTKTGKTYKNYVLAKADKVEQVNENPKETPTPKKKKSIF